jgi:nucleoporin NUP42
LFGSAAGAAGGPGDDWITGGIATPPAAAAAAAVPVASAGSGSMAGKGSPAALDSAASNSKDPAQGSADQQIGGMTAADIAAAWQADRFELGKVPEVAPPPEVC